MNDISKIYNSTYIYAIIINDNNNLKYNKQLHYHMTILL